MKELGVLITNCTCLVHDVAKIFSVYWSMGRDDARIPSIWPKELSTKFNTTSPLKIEFNADYSFNTYLSVSANLIMKKFKLILVFFFKKKI